MKKANKWKSLITAGVLSAGMVFSMVPAYAADSATTTLEVTGVEEGSEVYAYPIVQEQIDAKGNYSWKYGESIESMLEGGLDTMEFIHIYTTLNSTVEAGNHDGAGSSCVGTPVKLSADATTATTYRSADNMVPGLYIITADKENASTSYNFMAAAINYKYDAAGVATVDEDANGIVTIAAKKTSEPSIDKSVVEEGQDLNYGDAQVGDTVQFKISVTVPDYSTEYDTENLHFLITDALTTGLTLNADSIKLNGKTFDAYKQQATSTLQTTANSITLNLFGKDVYSVKGGTLDVTYSAVVNENAKVNFASDTNTAKVKYSTTPNSTDLSGEKEDKTYHYTFGIDTNLNGSGSSQTSEVTKKGIVTKNNVTESIDLAGAEFQLLDSNGTLVKFDAVGKVSTAAGAVDHVTSGSSGQLKIEGLDAGTYTLKESKAPKGYSLSTTEYTVTIVPTYADDGQLQNYRVDISGGNASATFTHTKKTDGTIVPSSNDTFEINNTTMANLPETGGAGVIAVTIAGAAMMGGFGAVFLNLKKKKG